MDMITAQETLRRIEDLTAFSKRSKVPLRTLFRIKAGKCRPIAATLSQLDADLKRIKPPMREAATTGQG